MPDVRLKRISREIVVRGTDVSVPQPIANPIERRMVVARSILIVNDNTHAVLTFKIEEIRLFITHHDCNVGDTCISELLNLTLNKYLSPNPQETFGFFIGDGCKATREAGSQDDGIIDFVWMQGLESSIGYLSTVNKALFRKISDCSVDSTQR